MKLAVRIHSYVLQQILIKLHAAWRVFIGLPGDLIGQHLSVQGEYSMNHTGCHKQSYAQDTYLKLKLAEDLGAAAYTPPHHVIHLNTTGLVMEIPAVFREPALLAPNRLFRLFCCFTVFYRR